jgi:hypothetical protein
MKNFAMGSCAISRLKNSSNMGLAIIISQAFSYELFLRGKGSFSFSTFVEQSVSTNGRIAINLS